LQIEHLSRRFGGLRAVEDVSLEVKQGDRHAIIGPNGAGKSTLFNLITGQLKPTSGTVKFDGRDITGKAPHVIARTGIGRAFEIAISVALGSKLVLLDEPTAGMSAYETDKAMELVRRLATERHLTLLFCEHDMSVVFSTARTVTVMHQGRVLTEGTPEQIRHNPDVQKVYLGELEQEELGA